MKKKTIWAIISGVAILVLALMAWNMTRPKGLIAYADFRTTANKNLANVHLRNRYPDFNSGNKQFTKNNITMHATVERGQLMSVSTSSDNLSNSYVLSIYAITKTLGIPNSVLDKVDKSLNGATLSSKGVKQNTVTYKNAKIQMENLDDTVTVFEVSTKDAKK